MPTSPPTLIFQPVQLRSELLDCRRGQRHPQAVPRQQLLWQLQLKLRRRRCCCPSTFQACSLVKAGSCCCLCLAGSRRCTLICCPCRTDSCSCYLCSGSRGRWYCSWYCSCCKMAGPHIQQHLLNHPPPRVAVQQQQPLLLPRLCPGDCRGNRQHGAWQFREQCRKKAAKLILLSSSICSGSMLTAQHTDCGRQTAAARQRQRGTLVGRANIGDTCACHGVWVVVVAGVGGDVWWEDVWERAMACLAGRSHHGSVLQQGVG